jgi:hypothetical protein
MKESGFLQLRRGLWEHIREGRMSITEGLAFVYICSQADTRTGIWKGCAKSLCGELGIPGRTARDVLERMEHDDYIRRFAIPGRHICYPILVHKFEITQGEHDGAQLNALESKSPAELSYFSREQNDEQHGEHGVRHGAAQRRSENRDKRNKKGLAAKTAPPADPRFQPFFSYAHNSYKAKHLRPPIWTGKDRNALRSLLRGQSEESLPLARLTTLWEHFSGSTEPFTAKQGDSLAYFCSNLDKFSDGPMLQSKGKANGKDINDAVATTMRGYAVNSGITR